MVDGWRDFSGVFLGYAGQGFCLKLSWEFLALFRGLSCICKNGKNGEFFRVIFGFGIEWSVDVVVEGRRHDSVGSPI